jgi:penicillin-binding protein 1A
MAGGRPVVLWSEMAETDQKPPDGQPRAPRRILRALAIGAGALALALALALAWLWPRCVGSQCPSVEALQAYSPPQATVLLDKDGRLLARLAPEQRIVIPLSTLPPHVWRAFVAIEDRRFFEHHGVDWRRVAGALWSDLRSWRAREGSSTITMQLARNVFPERLTRARTLRRKLWEVVLARQFEERLSKQQILELYLNQIYLGDGLYGVEAAARGYFGRPASKLTLAQAALLAALPKGPSQLNPRHAPEAALQRRNLVLRTMADAEIVTRKQAEAARKEKLRLAAPEEEGDAPWFVAAARKELVQRYGPDAATNGYRVRTTLDAAVQRSASREVGRQIEAVESGRLGHFAGPRCAGKDDADPQQCLQGLAIVLDAQDGAVRALVGGRDYRLSQFDRTTQAHRQPGSAFKPIVWAAALDAGIPASTVLGNRAPPIGWQPADHLEETGRPLTLREALRVSSNRAAVDLAGRVGIARVQQLAQRLGLNTPVPDWPSTPLGVAEVVPLELTAAYAPFLNGGYRIQPRFIDEVRDASGNLLLQTTPQREPVLSPGAAFVMASLLGEVLDRGTGQPARAQLPPGLPAAGKTGTTNDSQDLWFVGGTPEVVAGVWLGFDQPRRVLAAGTGGRLAAPLWARVVRSAVQGRPMPAPWAPPPGVEQHAIDTQTGKLANGPCPSEQVVQEWFLAGTAPTEDCPLHRGGLVGFFERLFGH